MTLGQHARRRARSYEGQGRPLLGLVPQLAQAVEKLLFNSFRVRIEQDGEPLQVRPELIAQYVRNICQFRRKLSRLHECSSAD
jgi:hypothetical protein